MRDDGIRWTLWNAGRSITCTERVEPNGFEVQVTYDSLPLATQHCDEVEEALRWSNQIRTRWEAFGWTMEPPARESYPAALERLAS
jgi:hypothetical protein